MARKLKMKKQTGKVKQRIENMSDSEVAQRWVAMRPRYLKFLMFFITAAVGLWVANHFQHFGQTTLNIVNVAFQIFCVFVVLFGFLTAMSFIYGRVPVKSSR